jgi:hypothetical protein
VPAVRAAPRLVCACPPFFFCNTASPPNFLKSGRNDSSAPSLQFVQCYVAEFMVSEELRTHWWSCQSSATSSYFLLPTSYFLLPTSYFLLPNFYFCNVLRSSCKKVDARDVWYCITLVYACFTPPSARSYSRGIQCPVCNREQNKGRILGGSNVLFATENRTRVVF